jgi:hypothetical protein
MLLALTAVFGFRLGTIPHSKLESNQDPKSQIRIRNHKSGSEITIPDPDIHKFQHKKQEKLDHCHSIETQGLKSCIWLSIYNKKAWIRIRNQPNCSNWIRIQVCTADPKRPHTLPVMHALKKILREQNILRTIMPVQIFFL